ncbi:MAG: hypothetical protein ACFE9L_14635 [Candidatus Hodarchaeota archaeon]
MVTKFLTTKMSLAHENFDAYLKIEEKLREKFPKLGVQTGRMYFKGQKVLFRTFYKLNYPKDVNDEAIKLLFWKYVDTHTENYIQKYIKSIYGLFTYCKSNNIPLRKDITQMKIFLPDPEIIKRKLEKKLGKIQYNQDESTYFSKKNFNQSNNDIKRIITAKNVHINSRPLVYSLLTTIQKIGHNFLFKWSFTII